MTLYLKYRPQTFNDLDLESVRDTLKKLVSAKETPHAFLFSGPKGLGKTSAARILAKALNCENLKDGEPCNSCDTCRTITEGTNIDVIEIDAASHRGIDDIRTLREAVKLAPAVSKKKIYIVDEAHMLTVEASNALLKTLEEPPSHVVFILATTNPEKLIDTVRSRATAVNFKKPTKIEMLRALTRVATKEKMEVSEDVLSRIVEASRGAFRDAVKLLENVRDGGEETLTAGSLLSVDDTEEFLKHIEKKELEPALKIIDTLSEKGVSIATYTQKLVERMHLALLANAGVGEALLAGWEKGDILSFLKLLLTTNKDFVYAPIESLPLQIAIIEWCSEGELNTSKKKEDDEPKKAESAPEEKEVAKDKKVEVKVVENGPAKALPVSPVEAMLNAKISSISASLGGEAVVAPTEAEVVDLSALGSEFKAETWGKIVSSVSPKNKAFETLLKASKPVSFDGKTLTLGVFYGFHKERLESPPHRQMLDDVITQILGEGVRVVCTLTEPPASTVEQSKADVGVVLTEAVLSAEPPLTQPQSEDIIKLAKEVFGN